MAISGRRRRWLTIVAGVAVLLVFVGIAAILIVTSLVRENLGVERSTEQGAIEEFQKIHGQFGGRPVLLEFDDQGRARAVRRPASGPTPAVRLETLHVLAWDPDDEQLARFRVPFWLLRLKSTPIEIAGYAAGVQGGGVELRVDDIERYGPGVILDYTSRDGDRVLFWAQ